MKHVRRYLNCNRTINIKHVKCYRHNMNIFTFLKSNYKYKRRTILCHNSIKQQRQFNLPYSQQKQNQTHHLPLNQTTTKENKHITKKIPLCENIQLGKFLRIYSYILIMQQPTPTINKSNTNNFLYFRNGKSDNSRSSSQLIAKLKEINIAKNKSVGNLKRKNEDGIIGNHRTHIDANRDTNISVDICNMAREISYQQHNYDKVSTITSTPIKCSTRMRQQIKRTHLSSTPLSQSPTFSLTTTVTTCTLLSTPPTEYYETFQCTAILRHFVHCSQSIHTNKHTQDTNSLANRRTFSINNNNSSRNGTAPSAKSICQSVYQYVNATWNHGYSMSCFLLTLFIAFTIGIPSTTAGACWQKVLDNGKCNEIFSLNISKSECCGANQEFAYTEREPTNVEYFFATAIGGGMECSPCLESCLDVKCGLNKKCIKRKGRPKCVCAPECGAARRKRKQKESFIQQELQLHQSREHHTLHSASSLSKEDNNEDNDGYFQDVPSSNAFKIKIEKSQQSRDTRSLSSEITNANLGLENGKDVLISSDVTALVQRHHCKEHNQDQRKLKYTHHSHEHRLQQQFKNQPNHNNQEPKGSRRLLITANVEHAEKPTTRRLQIFSNVRTTQARRANSNSNRKKYGQSEGTDPSDYYDETDEDNNDAEDDAKEAKKKSTIIDIGNSNKNNRDDDSKRFSNQSSSRHKLKTNIKPNNSNNKNINRNKNQHYLQTTKIRQHSNKNYTRVIHPQQNGRHAGNTPHHRHRNHNHHSHNQHHRQQQQQQLEEHRHNNHQQQSQRHGIHKHSSTNKEHHKTQTIVLKKPKNNKDYNITTTSTNTNRINNTIIAVVNTATTTEDNNLSNNDTHVTAIDGSYSTLLQTGIVKIATKPISLNASSTAATTSPQGKQSQKLLLPSTTYTLSSDTPLNSAMSADDDAAADDHNHSRLPNRGSKIATSSLLSAASYSSSLPSPSLASPSSHLQIPSVSVLSPSEPSFFTSMSAMGEGGTLHDLPTTNLTYSTNNSEISSTLQLSLHNNQQQDQQQPQPKSQHHYQTSLFDGIYEQFDLIGFPNHKQEQAVTNGDNERPLNPVCGTDGRTYNTECQLRKRACRTDNNSLKIAYLGHCRTTCNGVKCLNGLTCVEDQYTTPHCIACNIECSQDDYDRDVVGATRSVCGADGKTYKSTCDINRMICKIGRSIAVAYPGPCREEQVTCDDINCGPKQVCLIDLLTHKPRCTSCRYKCSRKRRPSFPQFDDGKICGFNNRTYNSWCEMRKDSCNTGFYIDVKYAGDCQ